MASPSKPKRKSTQLPLKLTAGKKTDVRTQFAALCYRGSGDDLEVCLITSRRTKRWILPKGWPMHKQTPADAAATEAWEEAGLTGRATDRCLGAYAYVKSLSTILTPVIVAKRLAEPELRRIVRRFDPGELRNKR